MIYAITQCLEITVQCMPDVCTFYQPFFMHKHLVVHWKILGRTVWDRA